MKRTFQHLPRLNYLNNFLAIDKVQKSLEKIYKVCNQASEMSGHYSLGHKKALYENRLERFRENEFYFMPRTLFQGG